MTGPGDDNDPIDQLGNEGRRIQDLLRGRGYWRSKNLNRTPGGCGSNALLFLAIIATAALFVASV
jgi:hypothetical protein